MESYTIDEWKSKTGIYHKDDVLRFLELQREECYKQAKVKCSEYVNPYSDNDGNKEYYIDKNSILNAKIEI